MGVARLVRADHSASRTRTTPSGAVSAMASPISPIIDSRPMVGVENRLRTVAGRPANISTTMPDTPATRGSHPMLTPSKSNSEPTA